MLKSTAMLALALVFAGPALAAPDDAPRAASQSARGIMRYDANQDGVIDRAEWVAGQQARFKQLDVDRDGKLSPDEMFARTPSAGSVVPTDQQVQRQTSFFRRVDSDGNGTVSQSEFMAQADRNFVRCDADRDGRTNTAECRQALQRRPSEPVRQDR